MIVQIDTNVVLDVLCAREPFYADSLKIFKLCEVGKIEGHILSLSIADIVYILRKELTADSIKEILDKLFLIFKIDDLKAEDLKSASELHFSDYEDALQTVCAKRNRSSYIVSRNTKDFSQSSIQAITPAEFIKLII